jgi:hypothetical protein
LPFPILAIGALLALGCSTERPVPASAVMSAASNGTAEWTAYGGDGMVGTTRGDFVVAFALLD